MSAATQATVLPKKLTDIPIFDADAHWTEPPDLWTGRAPQKYKGQVMHVRRADDGTDFWFLGERRLGAIGPGVVKPDLSKNQWFSLQNYESMSRAGTYVPERLEVMNGLGVGTQVVYPNAMGFGGLELLSLRSDPGLHLFHFQAYNDALAEQQKESGNRLLGQIVPPLWDIDQSVKELIRGRKLGLTGVTITDQPQYWKQPSLASPVWDPVWATCQELELPVSFHIGSVPFEDVMKCPTYWGDTIPFVDDGSGEQQLNTKYACYMTATLEMSNQCCVLNLLVSGILERFPRLKFVSVESGISWTPFALQSLEAIMHELVDPKTLAKAKRTPTEIFREQIFVTYWFEDRNAVEFYLKAVGSDNILFETDFPHPAGIYPDVQKYAHDGTVGLDEETRRKIYYKNAEKLFGVEVGATS